MKIFNLFRKKAKTQELPDQSALERNQDSDNLMRIAPHVDLFVDNEEPAFKIKPEEKPKNRIMELLNRNFHAMGINDGFEYHTKDTLDRGIMKIKAEFQLIIDQEIQGKREKLLQMRLLVVDVRKINEETRERLELNIEELNNSLELLLRQKELSSEDEGWVMNAIHNYQQGFTQGLNDHIDAESFINSIKNL